MLVEDRDDVAARLLAAADLPAGEHVDIDVRIAASDLTIRSLEGTITNVFAGGQFEVETDAGPTVRAKLCGRMRKYRIRVILGDRVTVALSPYDLNHGMIVYRTK